MNYVQSLLNSDVKINLTEIVTQNKDVIASKLMMEINKLELMSDQISECFSSQSSALARWQKNDGSLIPPKDFIPICEKTGLIISVDMKIFEITLAFATGCLSLWTTLARAILP